MITFGGRSFTGSQYKEVIAYAERISRKPVDTRPDKGYKRVEEEHAAAAATAKTSGHAHSSGLEGWLHLRDVHAKERMAKGLRPFSSSKSRCSSLSSAAGASDSRNSPK